MTKRFTLAHQKAELERSQKLRNQPADSDPEDGNPISTGTPCQYSLGPHRRMDRQMMDAHSWHTLLHIAAPAGPCPAATETCGQGYLVDEK